MAKKINIKGIAIKAAASGAGAIAAAKLDSLPVMNKITNPLIKGIIKVGLGAFLPSFVKGKNNALAMDVGGGMMAVGAVQIANGTVFKANPVSMAGVGELATLGTGYDQIVNGVGEFPTLGDGDGINNPYT